MTLEERLCHMGEQLERIEQFLAALADEQKIREWYTTGELASLVGKAEFTVRHWCRAGRIQANKRGSGRGEHLQWVVSHDEFLRYQRDGLLPAQDG